MTETDYKDFMRWARLIALGGSAIIMGWSSIAHGYVDMIHVPNSGEDRLEQEAREKERQEAYDKVNEGKDAISPKENYEAYMYYLDHTAYNRDDNHRDNCSDRLAESRSEQS